MKHAGKLITILFCAALTASCDKLNDPNIFDSKRNDYIDQDALLNRDDFRNMRDPATLKKPGVEITGAVSEPPIPELAEILSAPQPPKIGASQLVSVAVTDDVPIKDVLLELARLAKVDIDVDASITGGVAIRATDRPFNEVVERIADLAGLRYSMKNGVLRVERDTPYIKTYSLDLLSVDRSSQSSINSSSTSAGSSGGGSSGGGSGGSTGGSTSSINYKSDSDFWTKFEAGINQILVYVPATRTSATTIATQPAPAPGASSATPVVPGGPAGTSATPPGMKPMQQAGIQAAPVAAPAAPVAAPAAAGAATSAYYIVNRQASTLTVNGTDKQHELVKAFLSRIEANTSSQVLIEAKVVEVALSSNYQSGIDWTKFGTDNVKFNGNLANVKTTDTDLSSPTLTIIKNNIFGSKVDLSAAVKLLDEFGTTRSLSSPRLNAMNNQQAVLSFVENIIYFDLKVEVTPGTAATGTSAATQATVSVTKQEKSVPEGIVLSLQPSINKDTNEVTLSVRPTLTKVTKFIDDPSYPIQSAIAVSTLGGAVDSAIVQKIVNAKSQVPQVESRELDSIVKIKSGQTLVIGGLLEDKIINQDSGVPGVSEVPWLGNLFKSVDKTNSKKELVIFIRATIVPTTGNADNADKGLYEKFIQDPHPLKF